MPGIPTHFRLLDLANPDLKIKAENMSFAYLGAIGPSLGDFIPTSDSGTGLPDPCFWGRVRSVTSTKTTGREVRFDSCKRLSWV